ncbi:hypothetical protein BD311DRAFT_768597 [Dichomitus squalens]|uniref:F-box domain-containing protein n=1 Tax=Dichomitus squalens TaxID=114155 RepID=A0A4Q9M8C1_9APHY|nr:hypothetical protein BD311DRAFT_768597 [Dichomitus squalens]
MTFATVPVELLREILAHALCDHPRPGELLCVNKLFYELGQPLLYADLDFRSITQLILFSEGTSPLVCTPRTLTVALAGGSADFEVFKYLAAALRRCLSTSASRTEEGGIESESEERMGNDGKVPLELLSLRLHSHSGNPHPSYIYEALALANPKTFIWRGPDPEHHFSTAIVPSATFHLARAISTWTAIEHITLTNMSFPSDQLGRNTPFAEAPLLPPLQSLRTLYIGQSTLLPPSAVAAMVARPCEGARLELVRLVDTYRHSIWGPRICRKDVEDAAMVLGDVVDAGEERRREVLERVRRVVRCEKRTERIMGGDNGDEQGLLK